MGILPKALVLRAPGVNCDREANFALKQAGFASEIVNIAVLDKAKINQAQLLCFPGGFSFGDYIAAGKVFSLELRNKFGDIVRDFIKKDRLVLGICNGFQVLVNLGVLPFCNSGKQHASLINNDSGEFEDRWVYLRIENSRGRRYWFAGMEDVIALPVAHAEGKFFAPEKALDLIIKNNQVGLRYANAAGEETSQYPYNPNGALGNIAAVVDETGKVLGMMPHPERCLYREFSPFSIDKPAGAVIFQNARSFFG